MLNPSIILAVIVLWMKKLGIIKQKYVVAFGVIKKNKKGTQLSPNRTQVEVSQV